MATIVVARFRRRLWALPVLYLLLIIITWGLTCLNARRPLLLIADAKYGVEKYGLQANHASLITQLAYVLEALTWVAALLALPVIYSVLARATVVYSLRTSKNKKLDLRRLFALADGRFISTSLIPELHTWFAFSGAVLLLLAFAEPIVRARSVEIIWNEFPKSYSSGRGWKTITIGRGPSFSAIPSVETPIVVSKTRNALIVMDSNGWQQDSWYDGERGKYFQATISNKTDTGLLRQVTLRLDSEHGCSEMNKDEYPSTCWGAEFPYRDEYLTADICVTRDGLNETNMDDVFYSPWGVDKSRDRDDHSNAQRVDERIYFRANFPAPYPNEQGQDTIAFQCWASTTLAYFELPNALNNRTFGGRIFDYNVYELNGTTGVERGNSAAATGKTPEQPSHDPHALMINRMGDGLAPLMTVALAVFSPGSFYALAQNISSRPFPNASLFDDPSPYSTALSEVCPVPFRGWLYAYSSDVCGESYYRFWGSEIILRLLKFLVADPGPDSSDSWSTRDVASPMEAALQTANRILLNEARHSEFISRPETLAVRQFVISQPALIACSVLLGLQVLGILGFLRYAYKVPTWTDTLDSLAIARITHQLKDNGLLRGIGLRELDTNELKKLDNIDGMIGLEEPPLPLEDMSSTAAATTAVDGSSSPASSGSSSTSHVDAPSHHTNHSQPQILRTDDPSMGMSSIPIDTETVVSENLDEERHPNTTASPDTNPSSSNQNNNAAAAATTTTTLHPRISINIDEFSPNDHDHEGRASPPAYTPRTADGPHRLEPPPYIAALSVNELRVGAPGLVTRRIPWTRKNIWV